MKRSLRHALLVALAVGFADGCAPSISTGCTGDDACAEGERCVAGACRPTTPGGEADARRTANDGGGDATSGRDALPGADAHRLDAGPPTDARRPPPDAASTCPLPPGAPVPSETCNGLDDDCDGAIDEDEAGDALAQSCFDGAEAEQHLGRCRDGRQVCTDGVWGPCEGQRLPSPEVCDAEDNDCDGVTDEDTDGNALAQACYSGPEGTAGVGPCRVGRSTCRSGVLGPCEGEQAPEIEICDRTDNDCSGEIDDVGGSEDCGDCEPGDSRPCYAGPVGTAGIGECVAGVQWCDGAGGGWGACEGAVTPAAEECNDLDDDCDGDVDNAIAGVGEDCRIGLGTCSGEGELRCQGVRGLVCDALALEPIAERCNGQDDDCDGAVDEDFALGTPCNAGVGACRQIGEIVCDEDGGSVCTAQTGRPGVEDCNGVDDDCDGEPDEGLENRSCFDGPAESAENRPCTSGRRSCEAGRWTACAGQVLPQVEICDGVDNDCNGDIDDGVAGTCECEPGDSRNCYSGPAGTAGVGACRRGSQVCADGVWGPCEGETTPTGEVCDTADNDCNGATDDLPGRGDACAVGTGLCRREGVLQCGVGGLVCSVQAGPPGVESCNGIDDDCDGTVDDVVGVGAPCNVGVGACQAVGRRVCLNNELLCDATPGNPRAESCNGLDDNCNGTTDEGAASTCLPYPYATAACTGGVCSYTCESGNFNVDGDPTNGCERGCDGPVTGDFLATVGLFDGQRISPYEFSVAPDGQGLAAVAYVQNDRGLGGAPMRLSWAGLDLVVGATGAGETFNGASLASGLGRFAVFGNRFSAAVANQQLIAGVVLPDPEGGLRLTSNEWARNTGAIPGATSYWNGDTHVAVAYTVSAVDNGHAGVGRLQTRVVELGFGEHLSDGFIGVAEDYLGTPEARLVAVPYGSGTAVLAQILGANGTLLRFVIVAPNGEVIGSAVADDPLANATRDLGLAVNGRTGVVAVSDGPAQPVLLWSLVMDANDQPSFTRRRNQVNGGQGVAVAWGRNGPVLFTRSATGWDAWFLGLDANVVAGPIPVLTVPQDAAPQTLRTVTTGNRIAAAFSAQTDAGQEIRLGYLDCR